MSIFAEFVHRYPTLEEMQDWAFSYIESRKPDFVIGHDYMERWFIAPRNPFGNIMLNRVRRSDDAHDLHDHPWDNTTWLLDGSYREVTPVGDFVRHPGDSITRKATDRHALLLEGDSTLSFFITGPKIREWGFWCDEGTRFVPWRDYVK